MKRVFIPLSLIVGLLWAIQQPANILSFSAPFLTMRAALMTLTGGLALAWMGYSMLLVLRPVWLERALGGLDKLFHVHKWAGIGSVLLVATHWLLELSPKTLIGWGWVVAPMGGRPRGGGGGRDPLIGLARDMGEWGAWLMVILGIVAILRFVPYSWFRKLHKGFPVAFLFGAFHSVVLMPKDLLNTPFGWAMVAISVAGSVIAVMSLFKLIARDRRAAGHVVSINETASGVVDLVVDPGPSWPGHKAGQFALLTLDSQEGPHPFTIASDWQPGAKLRFAIKPLGDYTRRLATSVRAGGAAIVEGPYGCFDFGNLAEEQVWVAGGIGLAPFMARIAALEAAGGANGKVHLFYSVAKESDAKFPYGLEDACKRAGVTLHMRIDSRDGLITHDKIGSFVKEASSVWFCGPAAWGASLRKALCQDFGLAPNRFHQEVFEFR